MFLAGHPNHQLVFMRIWQIEPAYLTDAFRDFYEESPLNITRILDVAQDLKVRVTMVSSHTMTKVYSHRYWTRYWKSGHSPLLLMWQLWPLDASI